MAQTTELFAREFGDDPESLELYNNGPFFRKVRDALAQLGFEDTSWHNDANPSISWWAYDGSDMGVRIFIEWAPPVEQEFEPVCVYNTDQRGDELHRVEIHSFDVDLVVANAVALRKQVIASFYGLQIFHWHDTQNNLHEVYLRAPNPEKPGEAVVFQEWTDLTLEEAEARVSTLEDEYPMADQDSDEGRG